MRKITIVLLGMLFATSTLADNDRLPRKGGIVGKLLGAGLDAAGGIKTYDEDTLRVPALKQCLTMERSINGESQAIDTEEMALRQSYAEITNEDSTIKQLGDYLEKNQNNNFTSQHEVNQFNVKVVEYNSLLQTYNRNVTVYQQKQQAFDSRITAYNQQVDQYDSLCSGKKFYEDDMRIARTQLQ